MGYNYMLKSSKTGYDWLSQILIRYYNGIFLLSVVLSHVCVCVCLFVCLFVFFELETTRNDFFQAIHLYIWAVVGHEVGILSIRAQSFNSYLISQAFLLIL